MGLHGRAARHGVADSHSVRSIVCSFLPQSCGNALIAVALSLIRLFRRRSRALAPSYSRTKHSSFPPHSGSLPRATSSALPCILEHKMLRHTALFTPVYCRHDASHRPAFAHPAPPVAVRKNTTRQTRILMSRRPRRAATAALALSLLLSTPSDLHAHTSACAFTPAVSAVLISPDIGAGASRDKFEAPFINAKRGLLTYKIGRAAEAEMLLRMGVSIACGAI
eukprot:IDg15400t1